MWLLAEKCELFDVIMLDRRLHHDTTQRIALPEVERTRPIKDLWQHVSPTCGVRERFDSSRSCRH
jgi:hypothetical protein